MRLSVLGRKSTRSVLVPVKLGMTWLIGPITRRMLTGVAMLRCWSVL